MTNDEIEKAVRDRGHEDGDAAGSWVIDGNTSKERAREIFQGIEDGDPAILDGLPELCLGQWADDPTFSDILDSLDVPGTGDDGEREDELFLIYSDGWNEGMIERVSEDARNAFTEVE